jgi:hypothetical protein
MHTQDLAVVRDGRWPRQPAVARSTASRKAACALLLQGFDGVKAITAPALQDLPTGKPCGMASCAKTACNEAEEDAAFKLRLGTDFLVLDAGELDGDVDSVPEEGQVRDYPQA